MYQINREYYRSMHFWSRITSSCVCKSRIGRDRRSSPMRLLHTQREVIRFHRNAYYGNIPFIIYLSNEKETSKTSFIELRVCWNNSNIVFYEWHIYTHGTLQRHVMTSYYTTTHGTRVFRYVQHGVLVWYGKTFRRVVFDRLITPIF